MNITTQQGATPYPTGANVCPDGSVNFSVEAPGADEVLLVLELLSECGFEKTEINISGGRVGNVFFTRIKGVPFDKVSYYYLVDGTPVTDPCGRVLYGKEVWGQKPVFVKCGILKPKSFRASDTRKSGKANRNHILFAEEVPSDCKEEVWKEQEEANVEGKAPAIPLKDTIIYRLHVRGFSMKNGRKSAGTFQGLIEKLPYIRDLGATLIELMPAYDFDETTYRQKKKSARYYGTPEISTGINYWGYTTADYFAPKTSFSVEKTGPGAVKEFTKLVETVHALGMELGMEFHFPDEVPAAFACECLKYWVMQYGIDAVHLSCRDEIVRSAQTEQILADVKIFANSWVVTGKMHAYTGASASMYANPDYSEATVSPYESPGKGGAAVIGKVSSEGSDFLKSGIISCNRLESVHVTNLNSVTENSAVARRMCGRNVGEDATQKRSIGKRTATYQDSFLVNTRRFLTGEQDTVGAMKYEMRKNPRENGVINYLSNHNTMTLADTFSYERKHNEANGEQNRDGTDYNFSANGGVEGPTTKKSVLAFRKRQIKNALALLFLSEGTPMIMAGDEWGHTQGGNNNPYNQDNDITWLNWRRNKFENDILACTKELIRIRKENPIFHTGEELQGSDYRALGFPDLSWHGETAWQYSENPADRYFAAMYYGKYAAEDKIAEAKKNITGKSATEKNSAGEGAGNARSSRLYYVACNMSGEEKDFGVPNLARGKLWAPLFSTDELTSCDGKILTLAAHSVAVYVSDEIS
ncbi:MAG: hypothetical protein LUE29_11785 [Lachnospiraceae bacterium]|nr:hypothetical protein [Lachnospiraceae bacterium]